MAGYSIDELRRFFDERAQDPRFSEDGMVLSGYGQPGEADPWWSETVKARLVADLRGKLAGKAALSDLRVLEVGCAGGNLMRHLADEAGELVGVDLSRSMLRVARELLPSRTFLAQANGTALPFPAARFDRVLCYSVVTNLPRRADVEALVAEMARVLAPGGRILLGNTPDARKDEELRRFISQRSPRVGLASRALRVVVSAVRRRLGPRAPGLRNRSFLPDFFIEAGRREGLAAQILPIEVEGYTLAPFRFDVVLAKPMP